MSQESAYYLEELLDSMSSVGGFSSTLSLAALSSRGILSPVSEEESKKPGWPGYRW